jgi:hypothetical protein
MADAVAPLKPKWQLILGLLPSLNTCLVAIVTASLSISGTLIAQRKAAPAPSHELTLILGHLQTLVEDQRKRAVDFKAPPPAPVKAGVAVKR